MLDRIESKPPEGILGDKLIPHDAIAQCLPTNEVGGFGASLISKTSNTALDLLRFSRIQFQDQFGGAVLEEAHAWR